MSIQSMQLLYVYVLTDNIFPHGKPSPLFIVMIFNGLGKIRVLYIIPLCNPEAYLLPCLEYVPEQTTAPMPILRGKYPNNRGKG